MSRAIYTQLRTELYETLKDEMFAKKMMGDGVAFISRSGEVVSLCNGTVSAVFETYQF